MSICSIYDKSWIICIKKTKPMLLDLVCNRCSYVPCMLIKMQATDLKQLFIKPIFNLALLAFNFVHQGASQGKSILETAKSCSSREPSRAELISSVTSMEAKTMAAPVLYKRNPAIKSTHISFNHKRKDLYVITQVYQNKNIRQSCAVITHCSLGEG